jgi:Na+/H+ antiporter NhaD/arsenite permease-like protein
MPALLEISLILCAVLALLGVVLEEVIHINKAKTTLFFGCISWLLMFMFSGSLDRQDELLGQLDHNLLEIATLWLFLMSTMTFVAYLNARGLVQTLVQRVCPKQMSKRSLMLLIAFFGMVLSMVCDNVTATLVTLGLMQAFNLDNKTRIKLAVLVVFAVNSGGVSLITGDVTTLMIFMAGHVSMVQLFTLILPAAIGVMLLSLMLFPGVTGTVSTTSVQRKLNPLDISIMVIFFSTIFCTMLFNFLFGIPPVLTFLFGLSLMFLLGQWLHNEKEEIRILEYIRQVEYETLLFFLGILLLVGMLKEIGALDLLATAYAQTTPEIANYSAGIFSAIIDNVPLTAALIKASPSLNTAEWLGLTYAVGVGGSMLAIGSAAGIIAMSKVKGLTFGSHLRYFPFLAVAYSVGYWVTITLANALYG